MDNDLPVLAGKAVPAKRGFWSTNAIKYLTPTELQTLTEAWEGVYRTSPRPRQSGRYWLVFLMLRYTGARLSEVLAIDDQTDIDYRNAEVRLITLKQRKNGKNKKKGKSDAPTRIVPVPSWVTNEVASYIVEAADIRGRVFKLDPANFWRKFKEIASKAGIPDYLAHPHTLRHTRAIELLRAGVPVTVVQDILGHSSLTTTAIYLRMSGVEAKSVMRSCGVI